MLNSIQSFSNTDAPYFQAIQFEPSSVSSSNISHTETEIGPFFEVLALQTAQDDTSVQPERVFQLLFGSITP